MTGQQAASAQPMVAQPPELNNDLVKTQGSHPNLPDSVMMSPLDIHFQRERISQMMTIADTLVKAKCFGRDVTNAFQAFVKIQTGAEMGMPPMEAMNSLYIVNGKITLWGAAVSKRIRDHGWKIQYLDETDTQVKVKVSKNDEEHEYTATAEQLKKLGSKAAGFALADKLRWHALARLLRFHIPEVLGNAVSYIKEEVDDLPDKVGNEAKPAMRLENATFNPADFAAPEQKTEEPKPVKIDSKEDVEEKVGKPQEEPKAEEPEFNVDDFCKQITEAKDFDELNGLKDAFNAVTNLENRGGLNDQQVKDIWKALGAKLKEFPIGGKKEEPTPEQPKKPQPAATQETQEMFPPETGQSH